MTWPTLGVTEDQSDEMEIIVDGDVDSYEVTGLVCQRDYRFQVAAQNSIGWGEWSDPSVAIRMPLPVPLKPPQPTLRRAAHQSLVVQWEPAEEMEEAPILSFTLRFTTSDAWTGENIQEIPDVPANARQRVVDGLSPGENYTFQVRASNRYGMSTWSANSRPLRTIPGSPPSKIQLDVPHVYKSFVTLQWRPAKENGFTVTGHIMRCATDSDMSDVSEFDPCATLKGCFLSCDLRHLTKTMYHFQVAAFNQAGMSQWSDPIAVDLREGMKNEDGY